MLILLIMMSISSTKSSHPCYGVICKDKDINPVDHLITGLTNIGQKALNKGTGIIEHGEDVIADHIMGPLKIIAIVIGIVAAVIISIIIIIKARQFCK